METPDKNLARQLAEFKVRSDADEKLTGWVGRSHGARDLNIHLSSAYRYGQILTLAEHVENVQASVAAALEAAANAAKLAGPDQAMRDYELSAVGKDRRVMSMRCEAAIRAMISPAQHDALAAHVAAEVAKARAEDAAGSGVYIASKTTHAAKWIALREAGYPICSTWIDEAGVGATGDWPDLWTRCISEASSCAALVAYREPGETLKGAWSEVGAALAKGRKVYLVGDFAEFSIRHHPNITLFEGTVEAALAQIGSKP